MKNKRSLALSNGHKESNSQFSTVPMHFPESALLGSQSAAVLEIFNILYKTFLSRNNTLITLLQDSENVYYFVRSSVSRKF